MNFLVLMATMACGQVGPKTVNSLPIEWHGVWKGRCVSETAEGKKFEFAMELHIRPVESHRYSWKIVYGEGPNQQVRPYELLADPAKPGKFTIDEKNGILLDCQRFGSVLQSQFQVQKNLIVSRDELTAEGLSVEITTFDASKPRATATQGGKFQVASYPVRAIQRGLLTRTK